MKGKIICILVMSLMIFATVLPVATSLNIYKTATDESNSNTVEHRPIIRTDPPLFDSYINSLVPDDNFGFEEILYVGDEGPGEELVRSFLYFDLAGIPAGTVITYALLHLFYFGCDEEAGAIQEISVHRLLDSWTEGGVTWNNSAIGTPWAIPGGDYDPVPEDTISLGPLMPLGPRYITWDVTSLVKGWVDLTIPKHGLMVKCYFEGSGSHMKWKMFRSKNCGIPLELPFLEFAYTSSRNRAINTPFLNWLHSHPNMFPLLQQLINRLGLQ
jgi:hypothetical protein